MERKGYLKIILVGILSVSGITATDTGLCANENSAGPRPNILLIVADDLG